MASERRRLIMEVQECRERAREALESGDAALQRGDFQQASDFYDLSGRWWRHAGVGCRQLVLMDAA